MSEAPVYSTCDGTLALLKLRGGSKPHHVEAIRVANFVARIVDRHLLGDVPSVLVEGTRRTAHGQRTWRHEIPERLLQNPRGLERSLCGPMGAKSFIYPSQAGRFARYLISEAEALSIST